MVMTAVSTGLRLVGPEGIESLPHDATETEWLSARNAGIGASEVAAILGDSKYDSPYSLWARKTGRAQPEPRTMLQRFGLAMEGLLAETFAEEHPEYEIRNTGLVRHCETPYWLATPDRELLINGQHAGLLEFKTSNFGHHDDWGEPGTDEIPVAYALQCAWQMSVTGAPYVWVAALFDSIDYRSYLVTRDDDVIAYLRQEVYGFWHEHVLPRTPPAVDGHEATTQAMRRPPSRPSVEISLETARGLQAEYWAHKDAAEHHENLAAAAANQMRDLLDGAEIGLVGDRKFVTNKMQAGRTGFDVKRFSADHPDLAAQYVTRGASFPVLRIPRPKEDG